MFVRTARHLIAEQYTDMLAQDYRLRNVLLSSYHHDLGSLLQFDRRMQAYLEGMLYLKEETAEYLRGLLQELLSPGELFSVALFAANANDEFLLSGCLGLAQGIPRLLPALLTVVGWMDTNSSLWPVMMSHPGCRAFAAVMRADISGPITFTQQEIITLFENRQCVDFLLWFLGKSNSALFVPAIKRVFDSGQDDLILQGCRAVLCLRPQASEYIDVTKEQLLRLVHSNREDVRTLAVKYLLAYSVYEPQALINTLSEKKSDTRLLIQAMGWSGLTDCIPSLTDYFDEPEYARLSLLSVVAITGSLPERDGWQIKKGDETSSSMESDSAGIPEDEPEQGVSWPDRAAFQRWWTVNNGTLNSGLPGLCGKPVTTEGLAAVIANGFLNLRSLAVMRSGRFSELSALPAINQYEIFNMQSENR